MDNIVKPQVAKCIKQWGCSASIALLDPNCEIFTAHALGGVIGYRGGKKCAVVIGDPVCSDKDLPLLTQAFHERCEKEGKSVIYAAASEKFKKWAMGNVCSCLIEIGSELILDPHCDPTVGGKGVKLRNKLTQARNHGVRVKEYLSSDPQLEQAIDGVGAAWLKGRQGPQIFLANLYLFADREGKRWFYAEQDGKVIGTLLLNQLEAYGGWLFNLLMTDPAAPNGTSELLVVEALNALRHEGCHYVTCGITPPDQLGEITGLGSISSFFAKNIYKVAKKVFHLEGRKKYWEKFLPQSEHAYILLNRKRVGFSEVMGILNAFNAAL